MQPCYTVSPCDAFVKFHLSTPCPDHLLNPRWVSENGVWEIGVYPVMFGNRVRAGRVDCDWCSVDYCAGSDSEFLKELIVVITILLESFDETVEEREVERILPGYDIKPINKDPHCWNELRRLVGQRIANNPSLLTT